jgi:hypothetical protein
MNALLNPTAGRLLLVIAPHAGGAIMLDLIARMACRGPLRLLDGGNCFDVYRCNQAIARALRGRKGQLPAALERIQLARAFTCYQMVALLRQTPSQAVPTLVLDLLSTFYDESVPGGESRRLLQACVVQLQRLNDLAPVAISVRPGLPGSRPELLEALQSAASQVWTLEPYSPEPPARLF